MVHRLGYQRLRRNSPAGYVDRIVERVNKYTPDTDITRQFIKDLLLSEKCSVTGLEFEYSNRFNSYHNPLAPSIDRLDSTKGYYVDNVQLVLSCINRFKGDLPHEDFVALWKALTTQE